MRKLIFITALVALTSTAVAREEQKVFKWTDDEGQVHYGDSIPAEYADRPKERLNDQGVAVEEIAGKKTAEQLAEEARLEKVRVAQELQQRADQALLNTYLSVEEIVMHRDRRVELYQAQSKVTELYLKNLGRRLDSIRTEASRYQPYSEDPNAPMIPDDLARDLRDTKDTIARHENNLRKYERNERQIIERFDKDISRFKILKGIDEPQAAVAENSASVTP
jgi:hypothetical protein